MHISSRKLLMHANVTKQELKTQWSIRKGVAAKKYKNILATDKKTIRER